jgi:hypothetical protein
MPLQTTTPQEEFLEEGMNKDAEGGAAEEEDTKEEIMEQEQRRLHQRRFFEIPTA